jgi:predicted PhzF superfamily epimerase YddE/YHI9
MSMCRFTPTKEVDLCGHATLASAHALYDSGRVSPRGTKITFYSKASGTLTAEGLTDGSIQLDFPATPPVATTLTASELQDILKGFNFQTHSSSSSSSSEQILYTGRTVYDVFIEIIPESFEKLDSIPIDFKSLANVPCRGIIVTCRSGKTGFDFLSRCFFPRCVYCLVHWFPVIHTRLSKNPTLNNYIVCFFLLYSDRRFGIDEDPVTGSAHCALAPYWFDKLLSAPGGSHLTGYQASKRGGIVKVLLSSDRQRVLLSGPSITVMKSKLLV